MHKKNHRECIKQAADKKNLYMGCLRYCVSSAQGTGKIYTIFYFISYIRHTPYLNKHTHCIKFRFKDTNFKLSQEKELFYAFSTFFIVLCHIFFLLYLRDSYLEDKCASKVIFLCSSLRFMQVVHLRTIE